MLIKNEYDRQGLRDVGKIVAQVLDELARIVRPGVTTAWLDEQAGRLLERHEATATPAREYGFPGNLCISVNDQVVHGIPDGRLVVDGDLVKLDLTADKRGFVADATRMVVLPPVSAKVTRLADCARRACRAAIAIARPGISLKDLGGVVQQVAADDGFAVVRAVCGHGTGRRPHEEPEVPNFPDRGNAGILKQGMVITIEPIIAAGTGDIVSTGDGWSYVTRDGSWASHYEETVIIDRDGAEVVTAV